MHKDDYNDGTAMGGIPVVNEVKSEITTQMVEASALPHVELSILSTDKEIAVANTQALTVAAKALNEIATFITGGGFSNLLQGYAKSQAVTAIAGGLASHDGRNSLDARVMVQNGLEIAKFVETYHETYARILREKSNHNPDLQPVVEEDPGNRYFKEIDGKQVEVDKKGNPIA